MDEKDVKEAQKEVAIATMRRAFRTRGDCAFWPWQFVAFGVFGDLTAVFLQLRDLERDGYVREHVTIKSPEGVTLFEGHPSDYPPLKQPSPPEAVEWVFYPQFDLTPAIIREWSGDSRG